MSEINPIFIDSVTGGFREASPSDYINPLLLQIGVQGMTNVDTVTALTGMAVTMTGGDKAFKLAKADTVDDSDVFGLCAEDIAPNASGRILVNSQVIKRTDWTDLIGSAQLTPKSDYFLSWLEAGKFQTTPPDQGSGFVRIKVLEAIGFQEALISIDMRILRAAPL